MNATLVLGVVAVILVALTLRDRRREGGGPITPKQRTWLIVAGVFALVSLYVRLGG